MIVTYAHRYKRPPRKRKPQPPLPFRIVTAKTPNPTKRRRLGVMVAEPRPIISRIVRPVKSCSVQDLKTPTIVRPVTPKQRRWNAMRERMGLEP
jgi:hypothetical protein